MTCGARWAISWAATGRHAYTTDKFVRHKTGVEHIFEAVVQLRNQVRPHVLEPLFIVAWPKTLTSNRLRTAVYAGDSATSYPRRI